MIFGDWRLWLLVAIVYAFLWVFWLLLRLTLDLFERAWREHE